MRIFFILLLSFSLHTFQLFSQNNIFLPPENKILLILGQDLGAIGGFDAPNNNGYYENIGIVAAGVTTYTGATTLAGVYDLTEWGAGDICASCITSNPIYDSTILAIGLDMVGKVQNIADGNYDNTIKNLGNWIKEQKIPVFLRIGYEFDGEWNTGYENKSNYKGAFKRIVNILRENNVTNFVSVWQSSGRFSASELLQWYPGDSYVDWLGYSHFDNLGEGILEIARDKNKPIIIAEATPKGRDLASGDPYTHWNAWFEPFFQHIYDNVDVVKAVAYINQDWDSQTMWAGQGWGDSRVQANDIIKQKWIEEITSEKWLNKSSDLFELINFDPTTVGIEKLEKKNTLMGTKVLYENGSIKLAIDNKEYGKLNIDIFSLSGTKVKRFIQYKNMDYFDYKANSFSLNGGLYIIRLQLNGLHYTQKIVLPEN